MIVSHFPHGPTIYFTLSNVQLRHDISTYKDSTVSEQYPHLIFENFTSRLGERVRDILKYLFPVPKEDSKRVMIFSNENDFISFRQVNAFSLKFQFLIIWSVATTFLSRFREMSSWRRSALDLRWNVGVTSFAWYGCWLSFVAYEIRLGTIEQTEADREWVLSHYTRTARKRNALSGPKFLDDPEGRPTKKSKR